MFADSMMMMRSIELVKTKASHKRQLFANDEFVESNNKLFKRRDLGF